MRLVEMHGDRVRVVSARRGEWGYFIEVRQSDSRDDDPSCFKWWPKHFRFTLWGARRLAEYYRHKRFLLGMNLEDCE